MSWKETGALDQRTQFVSAVLTGEHSVAGLCRAYGISRKTGYKWLTRYREEGFTGMVDRSRAPLRQPNATPDAMVELIVAARLAHPRWGPRKLRAFLARKYPKAALPAPSTIGDILKRKGLVQPRRRRRRATPSRGALTAPNGSNESWSIDFKGQAKLEDGNTCYPLTVLDGHTRYLLCCRGLPSVRTEGVWPVMEQLFEEYGLPEAIRSDNGSPFASVSFTGLTQLSAWWVALGIRLDRIEPGHPEQNGRLERLHRTLKAGTMAPPSTTMLSQQRRFDAFRNEYNEDRPHEALKNAVPSEHYQRSCREYRRKLPEPEYPDNAVLRAVDKMGVSRFFGLRTSISQALTGHQLAYVPLDDGVWEVRFYNHVIGRLDERLETLTNGVSVRKCRREKWSRRWVKNPLMRGQL